MSGCGALGLLRGGGGICDRVGAYKGTLLACVERDVRLAMGNKGKGCVVMNYDGKCRREAFTPKA